MLHPSLSRKYLRDGKNPVAKRIEGKFVARKPDGSGLHQGWP
jgi:hypothetical protein